jgi:hypothetical protein
MKLTHVEANNRKHVFEVRTRTRSFVLPYSVVEPTPSPQDKIAEVAVDPELGNEGFTYVLESGAEGSVHIDAVLEYNRDPGYMADLKLYRLTTVARELFEASGLSVREVARRLATSPAQLYRLLDPTNYSKSLRQTVSLLYVLGYDVDFAVKEHRASHLVGLGSDPGRARARA